MDTTRYLQFNAGPAPGYSLTVTRVSFKYGDFPLTVNLNTLSLRAYYSTDNWSTSTQLTTSPLTYLNTTMSTFTQGGLSVPVPNGQVFSLRIYPYANHNAMTMSPTFAIHNTVAVEGRTRPVVGKTGKLCVFKFLDVNRNGRQDSGEPPLSGWTFEIRDASGAVVGTVTTNKEGVMCTVLPAGTYTVTEIAQPGYTATTATTQSVTVVSGQEADVTFGNRKGR